MTASPETIDEAEVLQANAEFYRAFTRGDYPAMRELWAQSAVVTCAHPMAPVLFGRTAVLESWRAILREPPPSPMRCDEPTVSLSGGAAVVVGYEGNGEKPAHLVATNVFVREGGRWRMVHHHAGPLQRPLTKPPPVLN